MRVFIFYYPIFLKAVRAGAPLDRGEEAKTTGGVDFFWGGQGVPPCRRRQEKGGKGGKGIGDIGGGGDLNIIKKPTFRKKPKNARL